MSSTVVIPPADLFPTTGTGDAVLATSPTLVTPISASLTAPASTPLTLTGGSTGASLVLGQGTNGEATFTVKGTGQSVAVNHATLGGLFAAQRASVTGAYFGCSSSTEAVISSIGAGGVLNVYRNGFSAVSAQFSPTGNLLIGTTTDMTGSGGLKIAGTTAATTTTSGALIVAGGVGVSGAGYFGGNLNVAGGSIVSGSSTSVLYFGTPSANYLYYDGTTLATRLGGTDRLTINASTGAATFAGAVTVSSTTPSTGVGTGALQVAGGIYAGAASVFGSTVKITDLAQVSGSFPQIIVNNSGEVADARRWQFISIGGGLYLRSTNDADSSSSVGLSMTRTGANVTAVQLGNSAAPITAPGTGAHTFGTTNTVTMTAGGITATSTGAHTFGTTNTVVLSAGTLTQTRATGGTIQALIGTDDTTGIVQTWKTNGGSSQRAYIGSANQVVSGGVIADFAIDSTSGNVVISTAQALRGTFSSTGLALTGGLTATGAVAIGNTVNTVSPTSPNRTVTMVIGGVTYYLAAKTTND